MAKCLEPLEKPLPFFREDLEKMVKIQLRITHIIEEPFLNYVNLFYNPCECSDCIRHYEKALDYPGRSRYMLRGAILKEPFCMQGDFLSGEGAFERITEQLLNLLKRPDRHNPLTRKGIILDDNA